jgi:hypothetical protein
MAIKMIKNETMYPTTATNGTEKNFEIVSYAHYPLSYLYFSLNLTVGVSGSSARRG